MKRSMSKKSTTRNKPTMESTGTKAVSKGSTTGKDASREAAARAAAMDRLIQRRWASTHSACAKETSSFVESVADLQETAGAATSSQSDTLEYVCLRLGISPNQDQVIKGWSLAATRIPDDYGFLWELGCFLDELGPKDLEAVYKRAGMALALHVEAFLFLRSLWLAEDLLWEFRARYSVSDPSSVPGPLGGYFGQFVNARDQERVAYAAEQMAGGSFDAQEDDAARRAHKWTLTVVGTLIDVCLRPEYLGDWSPNIQARMAFHQAETARREILECGWLVALNAYRRSVGIEELNGMPGSSPHLPPYM